MYRTQFHDHRKIPNNSAARSTFLLPRAIDPAKITHQGRSLRRVARTGFCADRIKRGAGFVSKRAQVLRHTSLGNDAAWASFRPRFPGPTMELEASYCSLFGLATSDWSVKLMPLEQVGGRAHEAHFGFVWNGGGAA